MKTYKVTVGSYGTQHWYNSEGQLHRENGPATIYSDGNQSYWLNGQLHREDGPAIICSNGYQEYYLNGQRLSEAQFIAHTQKPDCSGQIVTVDGVEYTLQRKS